MTKITRDIHIKAPVEKVFDLISDPHHLTEIWPNFIEVRDVKPSNLGGYDYSWAYKMSGVRIDGKSQIIEFLTNRRIVMKAVKGFENMLTFDLQSDGEESHLLLEMDYEIPAALLEGRSEQMIVEENEHEVAAMLENIKSKVELELAQA
jgi:uncharacterized membrane protein